MPPRARHTSACRQNQRQRRWAWRRSTVLPHATWHPWQHLARLVLGWSAQVQCNVRMVQREVQATRVVRDASASATINTADASTCHYLVVGNGLAHGSTQTEPEPELPHQPEPPKAKPHGRCEWREPRRASPIHQLQTEQPPEPGWEEPPPVFADCSHYYAAPMTSRGGGRRRVRVSQWCGE